MKRIPTDELISFPIENLPCAKDPDPDLADALAAAGLDVEPDPDGDFPIVVGLENDRSHQIIVFSEPVTVAGISYRRVGGVAFITEEPLDRKTANLLLLENQALRLASWRVIPSTDGGAIVAIELLVPVDADPDGLREAIWAAAETADQMELRLTGLDEY